MTEPEAARQFIARLRQGHPDFARRTDALMQQRGFGPAEADAMPHGWLEAAADVTNAAIVARDEAAVRAQVGAISKALGEDDPALVRALDCTYVEGLLWNIREPALRAWAWRLFPANVRTLHARMWGGPAS